MVEERLILLRDKEIPDINNYDVYVKNGGFDALRKCVSDHSPADVIQIVIDSNLRGRGGAGFSTGRKWSFIPKDHPVKYVAVNADESEPGTFKDRQILENNPYQLLEGSLICAYSIQATAIYIYCRGEFWDLAHDLEACIEKLHKENLAGENILGSGWSCPIYVHLGAGAYICGEESAMLSSLQGLLGQPRVRPPFPTQVGGGLYYEPTVVNNVETLANVPWIINNGADAYLAIGTPESPGTKIFCMSGHIQNPGNYEVPLGTTIGDLIELAGGGQNGKKLKALLPSGASGPVLPLTDEVLNAPCTYEALASLGSTLGSASFIFMDEDTDMVWATHRMMEFFKHESCGKCTPCREGTHWLKALMDRVLAGDATESDVERLEVVSIQMAGKSLCALNDFAINPVLSTLKHFRSEYDAYLNGEGAKAASKKPVPAKA
ncbi:MAG: NADH-quinone oxidoreductase subunit NuoF [Chloroflexi bacterium]|nr:NADH-quinone oxidoreductase subunit NuoF [Chloroflexota bacterium]